MTSTAQETYPNVSEAAHAAPPPKLVNYWGTDEFKDIFLSDKVQYFHIQKMDEGAKTQFQKLTNQDMVVDQNRQARVKVDPSAERHALITSSVKGWNIYEFPTDGSDPYPCNFSKQQLQLWLTKADPKVVEELEYEIRMFNPWMMAELDLEEIDKELDRLTEMKKAKLEKDAGETSSTNK